MLHRSVEVAEPKRVLGKILFWEEQLSSDDTVACGTCHIPAAGGADPRLSANPGPDGLFGTADDTIGSAGIVRRNAMNHRQWIDSQRDVFVHGSRVI